jgi:hypothetical protein
VGDEPIRLKAGDFNCDGFLDLVTLNNDDDNLSILINDGTGNFNEMSKALQGNNPLFLTIGDWDNDSDLDFAVSFFNNISILMNDGGAGFTQSSVVTIGSNVLTSGDWDNDGDLDLAATLGSQDRISILINDGQGAFSTASTVNVGDSPNFIVKGDFDSDGDLDLAVTNRSSNDVYILLNNNIGEFSQFSIENTDQYPRSATVADFDDDGDLDLAVANYISNTILLLKNRQSEQDIYVSTNELDFGVVSLDSTLSKSFVIYNRGVDSSLIIQSIITTNNAFTANQTTGTILPDDSILVVVSFTPTEFSSYQDSIIITCNDPETPVLNVTVIGQSRSHITGVLPEQNAIDVDYDTDIFVTFAVDIDSTSLTNNTLRLNGSQSGFNNATFMYDDILHQMTVKPDEDFNVGEIVSVALSRGIRNINGDSLPSTFLWTYNIGTELSSGIFEVDGSTSTGNSPKSITTGDWDGDGDLDLAVVNESSTFISILTNNGYGTFTRTSNPTSAFSLRTIVAGDWDYDGDLDLAAGNGASPTGVSIFTNDGYGMFTETSIIPNGGHMWQIACGDWDSDGDLDLATSNNTSMDNFSILTNNGSGNFTRSLTLTLANTLWSMIHGDWENDGDIDFVVVSRFDYVYIILNDGNGVFTYAFSIQVGDFPSSVTSGDLNADGYLDLIVSNRNLGAQEYQMLLLMNDGNGNFNNIGTLSAQGDPDLMLLNDWDGDGDLDLAVAAGDIIIFNNDGSANFTESQLINTNNMPSSLVAGDFNGDEDLDLAATIFGSDNVLILRNGPPVGIEGEQAFIPRKFALHPNYPNPFNPITTIEFDLPKTSEVTLKIFNILGEEVTTLLSNRLSAGSYSYEWDASTLASGVYLYRLQAGDYVETRKLILMR